jgi:hypothetical protein
VSLIPSRLIVTALVKDDDYVMIDFSAADGRFAGSTELYGGDHAIDELAHGLRGFPQTSMDRRLILLGSTDPRVAGGWVEINCHCVDLAGHPVLQVQILDKARAPLDERRVRVHLPVAASEIDRFVQQLTGWDLAPGSSVSLHSAT